MKREVVCNGALLLLGRRFGASKRARERPKGTVRRGTGAGSRVRDERLGRKG